MNHYRTGGAGGDNSQITINTDSPRTYIMVEDPLHQDLRLWIRPMTPSHSGMGKVHDRK